MDEEISSDGVTQLLEDWRSGNAEALDDLLPLVYDELRSLAARYLRRERPEHTLQPTALVHEAYFRLSGKTHVQVENRAHFFAVAAQAMRRILVDSARRQRTGKRLGPQDKAVPDDNPEVTDAPDIDLLALNEALEKLAALNERQAQVVELRYFGGLTNPETAEVLGVSRATVERDWHVARLWLRRLLSAS